MKRRLLVAVSVACLALAACGDDGGSADEPTSSASTSATESTSQAVDPSSAADPGSGSDAKIVASTTWTGAFAQLAGASDITVIAPTSVLHPPDYDPKPSDLLAAADADLVLYAEFESFAPRLLEAAGGDAAVFPLTLENTPGNIESEVMRLAAELGTEDVARANLDEFLGHVDELGTDLQGMVGDTPPVVVAQVFMAYWADWAGLSAAGTFGPAPMSADDLATLSDLAPTLVFDNYHVPQGQALEAAGVPRLQLVNYPGEDLDLLAVFQQNHDLIAQGLAGEVAADPNVSVPEGGDHHHGSGESTSTAHDHGAAVDATALHELAAQLETGELDVDAQRAVVADQIAALATMEPADGTPEADLMAILETLDAALVAGDVAAAATAADAAHEAAHGLEHHG